MKKVLMISLIFLLIGCTTPGISKTKCMPGLNQTELETMGVDLVNDMTVIMPQNNWTYTINGQCIKVMTI